MSGFKISKWVGGAYAVLARLQNGGWVHVGMIHRSDLPDRWTAYHASASSLSMNNTGYSFATMVDAAYAAVNGYPLSGSAV